MIAMWREREQGVKWGASLGDALDLKSLQASLWEHSDIAVDNISDRWTGLENQNRYKEGNRGHYMAATQDLLETI